MPRETARSDLYRVAVPVVQSQLVEGLTVVEAGSRAGQVA